MAYQGKKTHIHPFHAFTVIGISLFITIWFVSLASPKSAHADDEVNLSEIISEKDTSARNELLKPDTVMPIGNIDESVQDKSNLLIVSGNIEELTVTILPKGKHQNIKSEITIIGSSNLDVHSLQKAFTIVPNVPGFFKVSGRVASFIPSSYLAPQTQYSIKLDTTLRSSTGQILKNQVTGLFETEPDLKVLNVPYYRQQYSRSCEAASLRMALAYLGTVTNDMEIVKAAGYKPTTPNWAERIWDNPYEMFVGYVDGKQAGYGMYAEALAKSAKYFGHNSKVLINPELSELAIEVIAGHPIVIWGYINGTVPKLSYFNTNDGQRIPIYSNEHARTITGVVGSASNPVGFYINDPLSGVANEYWPAEKLQKHMSIFGAASNQALVVE